MKIAVGYTKIEGDHILDSFAKGVIQSGDEVVKIRSREDVCKIDQCDVMVQLAEAGRYEVLDYCAGNDMIDDYHYIKVFMKLKQIELNKPRLIIDCGLIEDDRFKEDENRYFSVGLNGFKGRAEYFNENSPSDRWSKRGIRFKNLRSPDGHVLIIGQSKKGAGLMHVGCKTADDREKYWNTPMEYYEDLPSRIRKFAPNRKIVFRTHITGASITPSKCLPNMEVVNTRESYKPIENDLKNAWCAVTRTSNGAIDALLAGIPVMTEDPVCLAYSVAEHSVKKIDEIKYPETKNLMQWLYNLSYSEWSLDEMRKGLSWQHFREKCKPI